MEYRMINIILNHYKLIVGVCVILFGLATIPTAMIILDSVETNIDKAQVFDYFVWFMSVVLILSGCLFSVLGTHIIVDYTREPRSYR